MTRGAAPAAGGGAGAGRPEVRAEPAGRVRVTGPLVLGTVRDLVEDGAWPRLEGAAEAVVDLSGVTRVDSAGLALLVEWLRAARRSGARLRLVGAPEQMRAIARLSNLEPLLEA